MFRCRYLPLTLLVSTPACQFEATFQKDVPKLERRPFGELDGELGAGGSTSAPGSGNGSFTSRRGPRSALWADVWGGDTPAPLEPGKLLGSLPGYAGKGDGPSVLLDGLAIYSTGSDTVAFDLTLASERWRATGDDALEDTGMMTNGSLVCGTSLTTSAVTCLDLQTGARRFQTTIPDVVLAPLADAEIRDGVLTVAGAGYVAAFDVETGAALWNDFTYGPVRPFTRLGDDLVVVAAAGCESAQPCLRALDPRTGATKATRDVQQPAFLLEHEGEGIFSAALPTGGRAVAYSPADDSFREAPEWDSLFNDLPSGLTGLTSVAVDGTLYAFGMGLCRVSTAARATDWCVQPSARAREFRVHPNAVFAGSTDGDAVLAVPGARLVPTTYAAWFESWGFVGGQYYALP